MKIKIDDLYLIGFYFLILTQQDLNDNEDMFSDIIKLHDFIKPCEELIINMVDEIETIIKTNK